MAARGAVSLTRYRSVRLSSSPGSAIQRNDEMTRKELLKLAPDLHARDLRPFTPLALVGRGSKYRDIASFLVRDDSIVLRMLHVKALIRRDEMLLFDYDRKIVQHGVAEIHRLLDKMMAADERVPFELAALEAVLEHVCSSFDRKAKNLFPKVEAVCANIQLEITLHTSDHTMAQFLPILSSLRHLESQLAGVEEVLDELLSDPADLASMAQLSVPGPHRRQEVGTPETVKDIEFLLDSYAALVDEIDAELQYHIAHVENLKDVVGMQIDHNRNRIITLNLKISAASLAAGTGAALGGLWGMNLRHGYEEVSAWVLSPPDLALVQLFWSTPLQLPCFATTVGVIGALSGAVLFVCYQSWWRMPLRAAARIEDLQSLDKLLRGAGDEFGDIQVAEHATARPSAAARLPLPKPLVH